MSGDLSLDATPAQPSEPITEAVWQLPPTLQELCSDDYPEFLSEITEVFLSDTASRLQSAATALAGEDLIAIRRHVHTIKGAALEIGARALASQCIRIECAAGQGSPDHIGRQLAQLTQEFERVREAMTCSPF
jgi:HPt (histidine-containing phosphotransfer) domain-containing protein